jgi:hypothetical protein
MEPANHEDVIARVDDLVRGWMEKADEWWPDGYVVRDFGIVWDVELPANQSLVSLSCTEDRQWAKAGLFRAAVQLADADEDEETDE